MRDRNSSTRFIALLAWLAFTLCATSLPAAAQQAKALHSFTGGNNGSNPNGGLIFDSAGNLYGTTFYGGTYGYGTVFELSPSKNGTWSTKILYSFINNNQDGVNPQAALVFDASGNLYGTTLFGGAYGNNGKSAGGAVFELSPASGGAWTEKVLHSFQENGKDGYTPTTPVTLDSAGNLYGTTDSGGASGAGIVFELVPSAGGAWTEKILHNFNGKDGAGSITPVIFDSAGDLYGTTGSNGGGKGCQTALCGTVFELTPKAGGGWTEKVIYNFNYNSSDGQAPGSLLFDNLGNLYGTTYYGGTYGYGAVFELSPKVGGGWTEKLLFSFDGSSTGSTPVGLTLDAAGNLYGETYTDVFELTPSGATWTEKVLYTFAKNTKYGSSGVILDSAGNLYGETWAGGAYTYGTVFEVTP